MYAQIISAVIRKNHGLQTHDDEIFSSSFASCRPSFNHNDYKELDDSRCGFELSRYFNCSLYVLEMFCRKCHNNQTTEYLNLPAAAPIDLVPFGMCRPRQTGTTIMGVNNDKNAV